MNIAITVTHYPSRNVPLSLNHINSAHTQTYITKLFLQRKMTSINESAIKKTPSKLHTKRIESIGLLQTDTGTKSQKQSS